MTAEEPGVLPFLQGFVAGAEVASNLASLNDESALGWPGMVMADFLAAHDDVCSYCVGKGGDGGKGERRKARVDRLGSDGAEEEGSSCQVGK
jgi:hypothetical protein